MRALLSMRAMGASTHLTWAFAACYKQSWFAFLNVPIPPSRGNHTCALGSGKGAARLRIRPGHVRPLRQNKRRGASREQARTHRCGSHFRRHLEGGCGARAGRRHRRDQGNVEERADGHLGRFRHLLRGQARIAQRAQSAYRRQHQDPRSESSQVPCWKSAEGFGKLAIFLQSVVGTHAKPCGGGTKPPFRCCAASIDTQRGCLAQLVERRPYKANVGSSSLSAPTNQHALAPAEAEDAASGVVVQSVRIPACHAGGRGFESRPLRQYPEEANTCSPLLF